MYFSFTKKALSIVKYSNQYKLLITQLNIIKTNFAAINALVTRHNWLIYCLSLIQRKVCNQFFMNEFIVLVVYNNF